MQHPKIILLTNEWVYHSPFFGRLVQLADYYPVAEGTEMGIERLRKKVEQGYSIVVFPEGTRSVDGKIGRFKKGAFYIAEMLNLDVQPLLLHGTGHTMRKGDFMLYDGQMTMSFLPRIAPDDNSFGVGYTERAKLISRYFKLEYLKLSQMIETPKYYKQRLEMNYVYKGPVEEWYARQKAKVENYYEVYHQHISPMASVTDIGCGYGLLAYMLNFLSPDRKLIGVDHDEDKIEMANHNFSKNDKLNFVTHDIVSYPYESQDVFVINDVLHYINYDEQKFLLHKLSNLLNPDGEIIIKDGDLAKSQNHKMTKLSELFSNYLGFNFSKHNQLYFFDEKYIEKLAASLGFSVEVIDTSRTTSNTIWLLKKLA
jgi:1-acyl-sn-glycerol-3-phosphate acyltransferase